MYKRGKYDYEFRLQCVEAVLKGNCSVKAVAKAKGIEHSNLRLWVGFYQAYGKKGLEPRAKRYYEVSFKLKVLKAIDNKPLPLREACVRFNIPSESVIENFFGIIKAELFYLKRYSSIVQLKKEIGEYINYYNNERIKLNLKGMSPIQYRAHHSKT